MFGFGSRSQPSFDVQADGTDSDTVVVGFSEVGLAGLTAVDYLVTHLDLAQVGHIRVESLPAITPFQGGTPRHHTRLYSRPDLDLTVLVGELFVPAWAADSFGEAVIDWTERNGIEETVVLTGVPVKHGPDEHRPYYIATRDYQRAHGLDPAAEAPDRTAATDPPERASDAPAGDESAENAAPADPRPVPMGGGYLDGINGALMGHGMRTDHRTCVLTTPVHAQVPDADAALRLLTAFDHLYDLGVDLAPLQEFAERVSGHYEELAARMADAEEAAAESVPEDRMYM